MKKEVRALPAVKCYRLAADGCWMRRDKVRSWTQEDTVQLLDPKMVPEDLQLMSRWIMKQRRAVLDPFIQVTLCDSASLHNICSCAVGSLLATQTDPFQLHVQVSKRFCAYERCCVCDVLRMLYLLTYSFGFVCSQN